MDIFWLLLGLGSIGAALILIRDMDVGHGVWDEVDVDFNEFEVDKFSAFDQASTELRRAEGRLGCIKYLAIALLFILFIALVWAYFTGG